MVRKTGFFRFCGAGIFNCLPGFVILVFGMIALYSSLRVTEHNKALLQHYSEKSEHVVALEESYNRFEEAVFLHVRHAQVGSFQPVRDRFLEFADSYYDNVFAGYATANPDFDKQYHALLKGLDGELVRLAGFVNSLEQFGQNGPMPVPVLDELRPLHEGIESLWLHLYDKDTMQYFEQDMQLRGTILYWSVIAIGLSGFLLVVLNTDKLKKLRAANEEKQEHLRLLEDRLAAMEASYDGIGIIDAEGRLTYMNPALMRLHGINPEERHEFLGQDWQRLYNEKGRTQIREHAMPGLEEHGYWRGQSPVKRRDGQVIHAELSLTQLPGGGCIGTARDITEEYKMIAEKEELQFQLFQAQKMEAIGRLAGGIAHDFNNILAAINGYAEFLAEDLEKDAELHGFAQGILKAGHQARRLVDQMLAFSRANCNTDMHPMDMNVPLRESLSMLQVSFPKSIEIRSAMPEGQVPVMGNAVQISQLVMNLAVNARDAIGKGKGCVDIGLEIIEPERYGALGMVSGSLPDKMETPLVRIQEAENGAIWLLLSMMQKGRAYAMLTIRDTGSGMTRSVLERVFEPFFTTKDIGHGTGLGLSTVHGVITLHQGAMIIETKPGEGTCFRIFLPLSDEQIEEADASPAFANDVQESYVLLVEDQEEVAEMMIVMLARMGVEALWVKNGVEALEALREHAKAFDAVVTDHNMPEMTGFELICKAGEEFPDTPFIMVSGYKEEELDPLLFEHPSVYGVMKKPIAQDELKRLLGTLLASRARRKSVA